MPQLVSLQYQVGGTGPTQTLEFDAAVNQTHLNTAEVTQHQVEQGANVVDHIRPMPTKLTLEVMVTNTPVDTPPKGGGSGATALDQPLPGGQGHAVQFPTQFDRVRDCYAILRDLELQGTLFSVTTTLETYNDMAITSMSAPRTAAMGNAVQFNIDMQEIRIVQTQTVQALPPKAQTTKRGQKPAAQTTPTNNQGLRSIISALGL